MLRVFPNPFDPARAARAIAMADIAGVWDVNKVTAEMTRFADAGVGEAGHLRRPLVHIPHASDVGHGDGPRGAGRIEGIGEDAKHGRSLTCRHILSPGLRGLRLLVQGCKTPLELC